MAAAKKRGNGHQSFAAWKDSIPDRPTRPRRRLANGRYVPVRNVASRANGKSRAVVVHHAGDSVALKHVRFDMRSAVGKAYRQSIDELTSHLGGPGEVSAVERRIIDNVSRLLVVKLLAQAELNKSGPFKRGEPTAALEAYRRAIADETYMLRLLGVKRRAKQLSLGQVLLEDRG